MIAAKVLLRRMPIVCLAASLVAVGCAESEVTDPEDGGGSGSDVYVDSGVDGTSDGPGGDATGELDAYGADVGASCETADDCREFDNARAVCTDAGECRWQCESGFGNPDDSIASNGCECEKSGEEVCNGEDDDCDGMVDETIDKMSDPNNCGSCGNTCEFPNAMAACSGGTCEIGSCEEGWANCDGLAGNGCEKDVSSDPNNCGGCGVVCQAQNATTSCEQASCSLDSCDPGYTDCNGNPDDGCEVNTNTDINNCGSCGNTCGTQNTQRAGCRSGSCYIDTCASGWKDCDGDVSNGCEQDVTSSTDHCGACNNTCSFPNAIPACDSGSCAIQDCEDGYHDLNGDPSDGCEYQCTKTSQTDEPDPQGEDANCDGIDGMLDAAVFVAPSGDDGNGGKSRDAPLATVAAGIDVASNCASDCDVFVAGGTYDETVELAGGVDVYGGYDSSDWSRDPDSNVTTIEGQQKRAVVADGLSNSTTLQGVTVVGKSYNEGGQSTYAVWAKGGSGKLTVENVEVRAGDGGAGADGRDGSNGDDGGDAGAANGTDGGYGGFSSCSAGGGDGGDANSESTCGSTNDGGDGTAGSSPESGGGGGAGASDLCGNCFDEVESAGESGASGGEGSSGSGGNGPSDRDGSFNGSGFWSGATGSAGTDGENGTGGGGGGAGGTDIDPSYCGGVQEGGGGGGGGAGGCAGTAGEEGRPGGGSFGVVAIDTDVELVDSQVIRGDGGNGGNGGDGGSGGAGGSGDSGAPPGGNEASAGGDGADGGAGGGGGGGAGACGGPSIGAAEIGSASVTSNNTTFSSGSGGSGGNGGTGGSHGGAGSSANDGTDGCSGKKGEIVSY